VESYGDVLPSAEGGKEIVSLKDETDVAAAESRQLLFVQVGRFLVRDAKQPGGGAQDSAHDRQERGLPAARGADEQHHFAGPYLDIETAQGSGFVASRTVNLAEIAADDDGQIHLKTTAGSSRVTLRIEIIPAMTHMTAVIPARTTATGEGTTMESP